MSNSSVNEVNKLIKQATRIVIIQADNPDADSLGSALALEQILADLDKEPYLYCAVDMPNYLHYLEGWSRVNKQLPRQFDLAIVVDASTSTLLEKIENDQYYSSFINSQLIVIDHHAVIDNLIKAKITINRPELSSTGEVIFELCKDLNIPVTPLSGEPILAAILGDTQGLSNNLASPQTLRNVASLLETGVDRMALEEKRRQFSKYSPEIFKYKAELISRTVLTENGVAHVTIPQAEINTFSPLYNPAALIHPDMLQTEGTRLAIVFKHYDDGKVTGALRADSSTPIAGELAAKMGGGGHAFASGFKVTDGRPFNEIKSECLGTASDLLAKLGKE